MLVLYYRMFGNVLVEREEDPAYSVLDTCEDLGPLGVNVTMFSAAFLSRGSPRI